VRASMGLELGFCSFVFYVLNTDLGNM